MGHAMSKRLSAVSSIAAAAFLALGACAQADDPPPPAATAHVADDSPSRTPAADAALIEDGREIAQKNCARCHAIGADGTSPNRHAPVFRTVLDRYDSKVLARELIDGMGVAHAPMPTFQFNPAGTDALIAFLESIQVREPGRLLVEERCARCHSIADAGASPYPGAQPFRNLGQRWTREKLAQALHTGILAEHDNSGVRFEMRLNDQEIADFFDFLDSIATRRNPRLAGSDAQVQGNFLLIGLTERSSC